MKILHVCLAAFYVDNYSYQENILPRMHKQLGHEVKILASTETFLKGKKLGYIEPSEYLNEDGIFVKRIAYKKCLPLKIAKKLRVYIDFQEFLEAFSPDIIFLHDVQFCSITQIIKYAKTHNVRIIADGHTDFINSARTIGSKALHLCVYKPFIKKAEPFIEKFYGTLPARVDFFKEFYKVEPQKVSFLPMGADDNLVKKYTHLDATKVLDKYNFSKDSKDFIIVTGGKISANKFQMLELMKTINTCKNHSVKLLVFGSVADDIKEEFYDLCSDKVVYAGWASVEESYQYFSIADLIVFPSTHSVYWEQAAGMGKPLMLKFWNGITHIDRGGNVIFLNEASQNEMKLKLEDIIENVNKYNEMKKCAQENMKYFSYLDIARRCIE